MRDSVWPPLLHGESCPAALTTLCFVHRQDSLLHLSQGCFLRFWRTGSALSPVTCPLCRHLVTTVLERFVEAPSSACEARREELHEYNRRMSSSGLSRYLRSLSRAKRCRAMREQLHITWFVPRWKSRVRPGTARSLPGLRRCGWGLNHPMTSKHERRSAREAPRLLERLCQPHLEQSGARDWRQATVQSLVLDQPQPARCPRCSRHQAEQPAGPATPPAPSQEAGFCAAAALV